MRQQQVVRRAARAAEPDATDATPSSRRPPARGTDGVAELLVRIDTALRA